MYLRLPVILLLLACTCHYTLAQPKIDSLKRLVSQADSKKEFVRSGGLLALIGWDFYSRGKFDSALVYLQNAVRVGKQSKDPAFFASNYSNIGVSLSKLGRSDSAIIYYDKALILYNQLKDTVKSVTVESNLAIIYKDNGWYDQALERAFNVLSRIEHRKPDRALASCYNTIGSVYTSLGEYDNALKYHYQSLRVRKLINYNKGIGHSYNNIGSAYFHMSQYDSALSNLLKAVRFKQQEGDISDLYSTFHMLGRVLFALGNLSQADENFHTSLRLSKDTKELKGEVEALHGLAELHIRQSALAEADQLLTHAEKIIQRIASLELKKKNVELRVSLSKAMHNDKQALEQSQQLMRIKDSLLNEDKVSSLIRFQIQYETEKKEQQIALLEKNDAFQQLQLQSNQRWIWALVVIIILAAIILVLLIAGYRASQNSKKRVENLLKELHHRVKNNLQILSSLFSLQSQYLKDDDAIKVIKSSEGRVNTMALLHKKLYRDDQTTTINMREYVEEITRYLMHTYGYTDDTLVVNITGDDAVIDVEKAIPIGLILNELISNSLKYAFHSQASPALTIEMKQEPLPAFRVVIADNGQGFAKPEGHTSSFGLTLVNTLVKELKGKLDINLTAGTHYNLLIPLYK